MARLPQPGSDNGTWGDILNEYLSQSLKPDGLLKDNVVTANTVAPNSITNAAIATDAVTATSIADGSITNALIADSTIQETKLAANVQAKLNAVLPDASTTVKGKVQLAGDLAGTAASPQVAKIQGIAVSGTPTSGQVLTASSGTAASWTTPVSAPVTSVAGKTGVVTLDKSDVGLSNADNTSDLNKPISTATQTALNAKADLVGGFVPTAQIPSLALNTAVTVADQAAMLALTSGQVQPGDVAIRTDGAGTFILTAADPSQLSNWTLLNSPTAPVTSVNSQTGNVVLGKSDVGLGSVDNTSDINKPISTATQTALNAKADLVGGVIPSNQLPSLALTTAVTVADQVAMLALTSGQVQPGDVAIRTDGAGTFILVAADPSVLSNWKLLNAPTDAVSSVNGHTGTVSLGKSDVGLSNVDNTSDATKNSATATLTNKTIDGANNTLQNIPQAAVTNLSGDLSAKETEIQWALRRIGNISIPARRTNFASWADTGTPSTTDDTGQTTTHTGVLTPGYPIISNGKWTIPATPGTGKFYAYRYFQDSANITRMGMRFSFDNLGGARTTSVGAVVLGIANGPWDINSPNVNNFKFGSHLYIHSTDWGAYTYRYDTNTFHTLVTGTFATPLSSDGTIYEAEIYRVGNTLTMVLPDGTVKTVTDPEVGAWSTSWGWVEAAVDNHDTDNIPGIIEYWTDTAVQRVPLTEGVPQAGFARNAPLAAATLKDTNFTLQDDGDSSKQLKFQLSGITASTTRTLTVPDANTTIVGTDATQTLTNKTLTGPKVDAIKDTSGNNLVTYTTTASAVNYLDIKNNSSTLSPTVTAVGTDSNISINFIPKGTGTVNSGGVPVVLTSNVQTLSNKTLTTPKIVNNGSINDENGNAQIGFSTSASAVNYLAVQNAPTGSSSRIMAKGSDANISMVLQLKNTGVLKVGSDTTGKNATIQAENLAGDTNTTLELMGKGTGGVYVEQQINAQVGTTYTVALTDRSKLVTLSNASAITVTIPPNSTVAFPVGTRIDLAQLSAGQVTVAAGAGVTINSTPGLKLSTQYSGATITKLATDTWLLVGDLSA